MMLTNNQQTYGTVSRTNHWISAIVMLGIIITGMIMTELDRGEIRSTLYSLHKSLGVGLFFLVVLRFIWLKISPNPLALGSSPLEHKIANIAKILMMLGMLVIPVSGWILSNSGGHDVNFFQLFTLPTLIGENELVHELAEEAHELLANMIMLVIGLHILASLKHHYIDEDNTLQRMLGNAKTLETKSK